MKLRNNVLKFKTKSNIELYEPYGYCKYGKYIISDFCVSDGQNTKGCVYKGCYLGIIANKYLHVNCGRHETKKVGDWWNNEYPARFNTRHKSTEKLNFALKGDLTLYLTGKLFDGKAVEVELKDIGIAQGHFKTRNKWQLGIKNGNGYADCGRLEYLTTYKYMGSQNLSSDDKNEEKKISILLYRGDGINGVNEVTIDAILQ